MYSLKKHNTFGINAYCTSFTPFSSTEACKQALDQLNEKPLIWGGGSNVLVLDDIEQPVLYNVIKGIKVIDQDDEHVWVRVGAGERWHDVVAWAVNQNLGGLENLSWIPGTMGAAPVQNIGAYGIELKSVVEQVEVLKLDEQREIAWMDHKACAFGYRDSIFKQPPWKANTCILSVILKLTRGQYHTLTLDYGDVRRVLEQKRVEKPTIQDVSQVVIEIRQSKLPDPAVIGNAGSFFKNPVIPKSKYEKLLAKNADAPNYKVDRDTVKIPAAWLIERSGWKGYREGDAGVHTQHALVLVNYGNARGRDIWGLAQKIISSVDEKFDILLQPEVNVIGSLI